MRLFLLFVKAWVVGVAVYWVAGSVWDGRPMGSGDFSAAALYSGVMFAITAPVVYLPAMAWVRQVATMRSAAMIMTVATVIHALGATALVISAFGGFRAEFLLRPEALLFYVIFGTAGFVLGTGDVRRYRSPERPET